MIFSVATLGLRRPGRTGVGEDLLGADDDGFADELRERGEDVGDESAAGCGGVQGPQWRTQLRLQRALVLLAEKEPVTAVAHWCGWSSASAFIDVFRRTFGHTPGSHPTS